MSEVMHLFGEVGERNDLIKVLMKYKHRDAAKIIADMNDLEYRKLLPELNGAIRTGNKQFVLASQSINEEIKKLADQHGLLVIALVLMTLSDKYAVALRKGFHMEDNTPVTEIVYNLREAMKLQDVADYVGGSGNGNRNKAR